MTSLTAALPGLSRRGRTRTTTKSKRDARRWPVESTCLFLVTFILYMALADYLVVHLHYMNADAYTRVADATYVLYSRDPHLGAVGFIWPPLPALLNLPILGLQHWFPFLIDRAFSGSIEAAMFGAGTVVLLNQGLRRAGILPPVRWLVLAVWLANPMVALYSAQGMSEAPFIFFVVASLMSFLRWTETRSAGELAALGVLVGLGTLCRIEMVPMALLIGAGIVFCSLGRKVGWRQLETQLLLYALPALFVFGLWIGSTWVIEHDPLYMFHSGYSKQSAATNAFGAGAIIDYTSWRNVVNYLGTQYLMLFPAVIVLVGAVAARVLLGKDRRPGLVMLALAVPVPLVDVYLLHSGNLPLILRYQVYVIPYTVMLGIYLLRDFRRVSPRIVSAAALVLVALIAVSDISSFDIMSNSKRAPEESVAIQAAQRNVAAAVIDPQFDPYDGSRLISQGVAAANKDHGLVAMDTFRGSSVFMTAPDRSIYVVTSDEDFEAIVNQPQVYHVEYFLVPKPEGESTLDRINQLYPTLWSNGDNFATLVAEIGGANHWRLYRINGSTGRG
jgi:hypothetical protein